jgi:hypothetical protein
MNDGRIISPLAMLRPVCAPSVNTLKTNTTKIPQWMRMPIGTSADYCEFHRHCTAHTIDVSRQNGKHGVVIRRVPHADASVPIEHKRDIEELGQRQQEHPDSIVVLEACGDNAQKSDADDAEANISECKSWARFLKDLRKKMETKNKTPLPVFARGISLKGHVRHNNGLVGQTTKICITSEGFLYNQHLQLSSLTCAEAEGDLQIRLTNTLVSTATPAWSSNGSCVIFEKVEDRDKSLRVMRYMISSLSNREKNAMSLLSSIEIQLQSDPAAEHGLSPSLQNILSPTESPILGALDFPHDGPPPKIMPQLIRTIRSLLHMHPEVMLQEVHLEIPAEMSLSGRSTNRIISRPLHLLVRSCFCNIVQARAAHWMICALANAVPAALHVKDSPNNNNDMNDTNAHEDQSNENTLLQTLLFSKSNSSLLVHNDFEMQTLQMLLQIDPSLACDPVSNIQGDTVLRRICGNLHKSSCFFHGSAYNVLNCLLKACPYLASQRIPAKRNQFPLHLLCCHDPQPRELRLLIDAYPEAAVSSDNLGNLPIHFLTKNTHYPECIDLLLAAAPHCMSHHNRLGYYPLHMVCVNQSNTVTFLRKKIDHYWVSLVRGCQGRIVCDFVAKSGKFLLERLLRWAKQGNAFEHYDLIRTMNTLDLSCGGCVDTPPTTVIVDLLSHLLPHCSSLTNLDISGNCLSREHIQTLLPVILQLPKLQHFNLDGSQTANHI